MTLRPPPYTMPVRICGNTGTIRPETPEGDAFFGLEAGTNGTAATSRRVVAEAAAGAKPVNGWRRSDGRPASGLQFVPSDRSDAYEANPWSGR